MRDLQAMDAEAMWSAKVGAPDPAARPAAPPPEPPAAAADPPLPFDPGALESTFGTLLASDPALLQPPPRPSAVRVGTAAPGPSSQPDLARPRASELRALERGERDIDRRIDLHGKTVAEALALLRVELPHAREQGWHYLLVISGRGRRSAQGPKLRPAVQQFLASEARDHVLWFDEAPPRLGGSGALLVRVRRAGKSEA